MQSKIIKNLVRNGCWHYNQISMNRTRTHGFNEPVCLIYGNIIFIRISLENPVVSLVILMSMISSTYHLETSRKREIDTKGKLFALALAKDCYSMDLELLTNASVVKDAARFVSHYQ